MTTHSSNGPEHLPETVRTYLAAHRDRDTATALRAFAPTAVVEDDGTTYRGTEEIRHFLTRAGAQFSFTSELVAAHRVDETHWVATHRLEGDFPGGVVDLDYRFTLAGDRLTHLVIGT